MSIRINSNTELAEEAKRQLKENDGYCPCALIKDNNTKCMCKAFKDKVKAGYKGECHCGLFEVD